MKHYLKVFDIGENFHGIISVDYRKFFSKIRKEFKLTPARNYHVRDLIEINFEEEVYWKDKEMGLSAYEYRFETKIDKLGYGWTPSYYEYIEIECPEDRLNRDFLESTIEEIIREERIRMKKEDFYGIIEEFEKYTCEKINYVRKKLSDINKKIIKKLQNEHIIFPVEITVKEIKPKNKEAKCST